MIFGLDQSTDSILWAAEYSKETESSTSTPHDQIYRRAQLCYVIEVPAT